MRNNNNFLFTTPKTKRSAFSFIFLSLILLILCFFIKIISISNFEKIKVDAVKTSVHSVFSSSKSKLTFFHPSYKPISLVILSQKIFEELFDDAQIQQSWDGQTLLVTLKESDLFIPFQEKATSRAKKLTQKLSSFLKKHDNSFQFELSFIHFIDLPADGTYPIYENLPSRRAKEIARIWIENGIPKETIQTGVQKGEAQNVSISLTFLSKEEYNEPNLLQ